MRKPCLVSCAALAAVAASSSASFAAPFKVFMISSTAVDHLAMSAAARMVLPTMGMANDFTIDATTDNTLINDTNLARYDVFLSMHLAPFEIKVEQRAAFENFIKSGKGWVGVHAAGLIIPSAYTGRNLPSWDFYSDLIGRVSYVGHPMLQNGTVIMEDRTHPVTMNMPAMFQIRDEWYEFSGNPRANVRVLGKADESTYRQNMRMGDHPLIWVCEKYPRAIYSATGHDASDWQNAAFNILIRDALLWAAGRIGAPSGDAGADALGSSDGASDAPAATDGGAGGRGGSGGNSGAGGSAGAGGQAADAAADTSVASTGGAGGGLTGSGGSAGTPATGGKSGAQGTSSGGCSYGGGATGASTRAPVLLLLGGFALAARRRRRQPVPTARTPLPDARGCARSPRPSANQHSGVDSGPGAGLSTT